MTAPVRAERPNFRTPWIERAPGLVDPYWQRVFVRWVDIINAQQAQIEELQTKVAALEQYNIDNP